MIHVSRLIRGTATLAAFVVPVLLLVYLCNTYPEFLFALGVTGVIGAVVAFAYAVGLMLE